MRPVRLRLEGFASFRQATTVDFDGANYFALVGPTGSGKSTVIDAITFALYGSVARWDKENVVAPALAPTVNRGTVSLIFDSRGKRYVVSRDVRRSAAGQVNVKESRLEQFVDPQALGLPEDETKDLASNKAVKVAVDGLLGLDFNQFTKCVALPQGDVAEFLHAGGVERHKILIKLLGLEIYGKIAQAANARATHQETLATAHETTIAGVPQASDEALAAAQERVIALTGLKERLDAGLPKLTETARLVDRANDQVAVAERDCEALGSVSVPAGALELEQRRSAAAEAVERTADAATVAEQADEKARAALDAAPDQAGLQRLADHHAEHQQAVVDVPLLQAAADAARASRDERSRSVEALALRVAELSREQDLAVRSHERALAAVSVSTSTLGELAEVAPPHDVDDLAARSAAAASEGDAARAVLEQQRARLAQARSVRDEAGDVLPLDRAAYALADVDAGPCRALLLKVGVARFAAGAAAADAAAARTAATTARATLDRAQQAEAALALRQHLVEGEPCPVCEQDIATLPLTVRAPAVAAAGQALLVAQAERDRCDDVSRRADQDLASAEQALAAERSGLRTACGRAAAATRELGLDVAPLVLVGEEPPTGWEAEVQALSAAVATRLAVATAAGKALVAADQAAAAADLAVQEHERSEQQVATALAAAGTTLGAARDGLAPLGAPSLHGRQPVEGWRELMAWVTDRTAHEREALAVAQREEQTAGVARADAERSAASTTAEQRATEKDHTAAVALAATAEAEATRVQARLTELVAALADADPPAVVQAQLAELQRLTEVAHSAGIALAAARAAARQAQVALRALDGELLAARTELAAVRDRLVGLGAPHLDTTSVAAGWDQLRGWAGVQLVTRTAELATARQGSAVAAKALVTAEEVTRKDLLDHGVEGTPAPVLTWAPAGVARAQAVADAAVTAALNARTQVEALRAQAEAAREQAQVAKSLAQYLRNDGLPKWLSAHALDVLVMAASETLLELSGGQFELLSDEGGFSVLDHNDADSVRMVKTLSGGETFQAALALALALSSQLGALSAQGAAQLEAIFIDEGFGTLDEATLDTVATTLENLAETGGRMVGLITHVQALASRVPVRYAVRRDALGSHVERE